jgi:rsbT co-antagonist protein RsbR
MLDRTALSPTRTMELTEKEIDQRQRIVGLDREDIALVVSLKDIVTPNVGRYADTFFEHLGKLEEAAALFANRKTLEEAKRLKREHLIAMVSGVYDANYVEQRIVLATLYSKYGLQASAFFGVFQRLMQSIGNDLIKESNGKLGDPLRRFMALTKVGFFDVGIMSDVLIFERERTINLQQQAIRELSTPVLQVRERLLILPIIGMLDSQRAKQLTDDLLQSIRDNRAKIVVMDITGVAAVDSKVANHLLQTVAAARLMGSAVIVTGLSAEVAQALVSLGVDLGKIDTKSDLQTGLEQAERSLGYRVTLSGEPAAALAPA